MASFGCEGGFFFAKKIKIYQKRHFGTVLDLNNKNS